MFTKERLSEVNIFFDRWKNTPRGEFKQEFASYVMETRGIPDLYRFPIDDQGSLISASGRRIRNIINRQGYIGQVEGQVFDDIENWVKYNKDRDDVDEEVMWVSPPYPGVYPDLKVVMSSIIKQGNEKWLFNQSIIFNFNQVQAQRFTQALAEFSQNYPVNASLENIRITPLLLNSEQPTWISVLEKIINDTEVWEYIRSGRATQERGKALEQSDLVYRARYSSIQRQEEAKNRAILILGNKPTSCPPKTSIGSAFQIFSENSLVIGTINLSGSDQYDSLEFDCPHCGKTNRRQRGHLIEYCGEGQVGGGCGKSVRC